jgi:uncharacterized integral membrane protein
MRFWMIVWSFVAVALGVFVVANWRVLSAQTALNLVVAQVTAPLGLVMIGAIVVMTLLYLVLLETRALVQTSFTRSPAGGEPSRRAISELRTDLER